jgi:hypothetical protein
MSFNLYATPGERESVIAGLYDLAIFLEDHWDVPVPHTITVHVFPPTGMTDAESRAEIDAIAARTGAEISVSPNGHYAASLYFGPVEYKPVAIPRGPGNGESE